MQPTDIKTVGIIGAGHIGQVMARIAVRAGRPVVIANSRGPESLTSVVDGLGDGVTAGTVKGAAAAETAHEDFTFAVKMEHTTIRYGENVILNDIQWQVRKGERWNVSGPISKLICEQTRYAQ